MSMAPRRSSSRYQMTLPHAPRRRDLTRVRNCIGVSRSSAVADLAADLCSQKRRKTGIVMTIRDCLRRIKAQGARLAVEIDKIHVDGAALEHINIDKVHRTGTRQKNN